MSVAFAPLCLVAEACGPEVLVDFIPPSDPVVPFCVGSCITCIILP